MARYLISIHSPHPPAEAFSYLADLRNLAAWDPGVRRVTQIEGVGGGIDATYDVVVDAPRGGLTLRYVTTTYDEPNQVVVEARSRRLTSVDRITVAPGVDAGSLVTYDADLRLNGRLDLFDPFLGRAAQAHWPACCRRAAGRAHGDGPRGMSFPDLVDALLEKPVVPSFTRVGYSVRSRVERWRPLTGYDLAGRTVVVTGATSGIGREAAAQFARLGARVVVVGRSLGKTQRVADEITAATGSSRLGIARADLGELDQVRALADTILSHEERVDVLVHNAGALSAERVVTSAGHESTVASQVLGPFLLTSLLLPRLRSSAVARVITMSSGGMYTAPLLVDGLEMSGTAYGGSQQYARAKRAQVTLNEMWGSRLPASEVVFHAVHPGWADTPGVEAALPRFRSVMRPLLRSPAQGADTLVWLAADDGAPLAATGGFWHDRRRRPIHRLRRTRQSDTPAQREALWRWCSERSGAPSSL